MRRTKIALIFTILLFSFCDFSFAKFSFAKPVLFGSLAPNFTLKDRNGRLVSLSDYRGKIVLLNFWASWCGPCKEEMPLLERLQKERNDIVVLTVNTFDYEERGRMFLQREKLSSLRVLFDNEQIAAGLYKIRVLPMSFIINKSFLISGVFTGAMSYYDMKNFVKESLEDREKSDDRKTL